MMFVIALGIYDCQYSAPWFKVTGPILVHDQVHANVPTHGALAHAVACDFKGLNLSKP